MNHSARGTGSKLGCVERVRTCHWEHVTKMIEKQGKNINPYVLINDTKGDGVGSTPALREHESPSITSSRSFCWNLFFLVMRTYSSLSVLCLLAATGRSLAESHLKIYPTVFRTEGFNSTEHELGLGVMPLAPLGNVQMSNIWGTPLVSNCPQLCSAVGPDLTNWTHIHAQADLVRCEQPILFDLGIHNEYSIHSTIRACAASTENIQIKSADLIPRNTRHRNETAKPVYGPDLEAIAASIASSDSCGAQRSFVHAVFTAGPAILRNGSDAASAVGLLASYLENVASCGTRIIFAKLGSAVVGLYAGAELNSGSASRHVRGFR